MKWTEGKYFIKKSKFKIFLIIVILSGIIVYYKKFEFYVMYLKGVNSNVYCFYLKDGDALPSAEDSDFSPSENSIFFHETSCRGRLTSRQACAIESAARTNPERQIYVLFSAPVDKNVLSNSNFANLKLIPNVKFARVHIEKYAENTPLEDFIRKKPFQESRWWIEHTSDLLRSLTLYKWGGIYLDTDMLVVRSLATLGHNWVAREDSMFLVNAAAIAISTDDIGRRLALALTNELKTTYRPDIWIHNGPGAITRVIQKFCKTRFRNKWDSSTCYGLEVYTWEYFFPVHYSHCGVYFQPGELKEVNNTYAYHLWNKLTHNMTIQKKSPLMKMAEKYCPTIFHQYGDRFGETEN